MKITDYIQSIKDAERRMFAENGKVEVRSEEGKEPEIFGYAAVFNKPSKVLRSARGEEFTEIIHRGAFDHLLNDEGIVVLFNHDINYPIGRNKRSATIGVDDFGLWYRLNPPNSPMGQNVYESIRRGDVLGSSFSFRVTEENEKWERRTKGPSERNLHKIDNVFDLGPVLFEAYPDTTVVTRNYHFFEQSIKDNKELAEYELDLFRLSIPNKK